MICNKALFQSHHFQFAIVLSVELLVFVLLNPFIEEPVLQLPTPSYEPPQKFESVQKFVSVAFIVVLLLQAVAYFVWRLGNSCFRVTPRLARIILRKTGQNPETLYDVTACTRKKRKNHHQPQRKEGGGALLQSAWQAITKDPDLEPLLGYDDKDAIVHEDKIFLNLDTWQKRDDAEQAKPFVFRLKIDL